MAQQRMRLVGLLEPHDKGIGACATVSQSLWQQHLRRGSNERFQDIVQGDLFHRKDDCI